jgi:AbiU2
MGSGVGAEVAKWRSWIEGPIRADVLGMHHKRMIWREVNEILAANQTVSDIPSAFWDFHHENYATTQAIAVRRQADRDSRTCSLARLVEEMRNNAHRLTRDYFVGLWSPQADEIRMRMAHAAFDALAGEIGGHLDPAIPGADLAALRSDSARVRVYVNEHVAHDMAEPTAAELPTFEHLHSAIESVGEIFKKYANVLTAGTYVALEPVMQDDWKAVFRRPWLQS